MTFFEKFCYLNSSSVRKSITLMFMSSVRHVGAHPDELQHGVSIQSYINLGKTFPRISRIRVIPSTQILARVFVYLPPLISQILDFICRIVLIFITSAEREVKVSRRSGMYQSCNFLTRLGMQSL